MIKSNKRETVVSISRRDTSLSRHETRIAIAIAQFSAKSIPASYSAKSEKRLLASVVKSNRLVGISGTSVTGERERSLL